MKAFASSMWTFHSFVVRISVEVAAIGPKTDSKRLKDISSWEQNMWPICMTQVATADFG